MGAALCLLLLQKEAPRRLRFLPTVRTGASSSSSSSSSTTHHSHPPRDDATAIIRVFQNPPDGDDDNEGRRRHRLTAVMTGGGESDIVIRHTVATVSSQREFVKQFGGECYPGGGEDGMAVYRRFEELGSQVEYRDELWKFCVLAVYGGAYVDSRSPLLTTFGDGFAAAARGVNYAVLGSAYEGTMHGSVLILEKARSRVALDMVALLVETDLEAQPLVVARTLYDLICADLGLDASKLPLVSGMNEGGWMFLEQRCHFEVGGNNGMKRVGAFDVPAAQRQNERCTAHGGYCCEILDTNKQSVLLVTRNPVLPSQYIPPSSSLPQPYLYHNNHTNSPPSSLSLNVPYISTIREQTFPKPANLQTPNLFDILQSNECLPESKECSTCLRQKKGANCETCKKVCPCYCNSLCRVIPEDKFLTKNVIVTPPAYTKDPSRLIPRIVHQTWFEPVTKEKYPNMSRLIESWKRSGWEYRFYDDNTAAQFLSIHFPPEVREAYDALIPGAFKADLFRYCTLLINGGVYADMDVMLEANLDAAVVHDVGFMTPVDEPGSPVNTRMCLWNGLIAAAPAHPYMARAIETVVNNVRNRFTSVDVDNLLCPDPELSVSHAFDTLFTAGPCILGASVNDVLKRHKQTQFVPGDIDPWASDSGGSKAETPSDDDLRWSIPGKTIILKQNKADMGAHRFTWVKRNLVVAATDMPDYDDRKKTDNNKHYSDSHAATGIYGLERLYAEGTVSANERIQFVINRQGGAVDKMRGKVEA